MKTLSDIKSLDEINYGFSKKIISFFIAPVSFFLIAFFLNYPLNDKIQHLVKSTLSGPSCQINIKNLHFELFFPKIKVDQIEIPKACSTQLQSDLSLNNVAINWRFISFLPVGIPFKMETQIQGHKIEFYYIQGLSSSYLRIIDQNLNLTKLGEILSLKVRGKLITDLELEIKNSSIHNLDIKISSKDFSIPSQDIEGFFTPDLNIKDFFISAKSENNGKIKVEKLILGNPDSPIRGNFSGNVDLKGSNLKLSPLNLTGELAFSESLKEKIPLIDVFFQTFTQKDGFYQIKVGGTLGSPKTMNP